jgi:hypothetical protein
VPITSGPPQDDGTDGSGGHSLQRLQGYFDFLFSVLPLLALLVGFLSPLPCFYFFLFLSSYWVAFGFVVFTLCTSKFWIGGVAKPVVWLTAVYCIDNFFN